MGLIYSLWMVQDPRVDIRDYLSQLRWHLDREADRYDMQELAEPAIRALSDGEVGLAFASFTADWAEALEHAGNFELNDTKCPRDGETLPCSLLRRLSSKYGVPDTRI